MKPVTSTRVPGKGSWPRQIGAQRCGSVDAGSVIVQEECDAARVEVSVVIGDDGLHMHRIAAPGFLRRRIMSLPSGLSACEGTVLPAAVRLAKMDSAGEPGLLPKRARQGKLR